MNAIEVAVRQLEAIRAQADAALAALRGSADCAGPETPALHREPAEPESASAPPAALYHTEGFELVHWRGKTFTFSKMQRAAVRRLWQAWERGSPEVSQQTVLRAIDSESVALSEVFRKGVGRHPAWDTLIVRVAPGLYKLDLDPAADAGQGAEAA